MLRTNLSTRPFYNLRAVRVTLGSLGGLLILLTLFNLVQLVRLTRSERALGARATQAEAEAQRLRAEATRIRSRIDARQLGEVAAAAQQANGIIDLRAFSWSELFAQLESTLPENVRLTSFRPQEDQQGRFIVRLQVQARRVRDLEAFIDALEGTGRFHAVLAAEEQTTPEGLINATMEGEYVQVSPEPATAGAGAGSPGGGAAGE